ncbi:MAG: inositol 2-dehydrogenase [candidate division KSB1 bacterium]|jgi:myo-inositol 2-dehydrogenase/D-chiro-inositol 1-dehydrogenase|nr:inositol 2-dehydrogenase [candidate division KSB1 bacterium]
MKNQKLRFGVIGAGRIGKIHAENLVNHISETDVVAISDIIEAEVEKLSKQFHIPGIFSNYDDIVSHPDIDAIAICSPTPTHYDIILKAAASGKDIFCEKPIDLSVDKIIEINKAVAKHGVKLMVGFNRRFDPNFLKVCDMVTSGQTGDPQILRITSRDPAPPPEEYIRSSGGLFLDMTIHDFDMARYLMNSEVTEVYARANVMVDPVFEKAGDWDTAIVMLTFQNGAMCAIDNSRQAVYGYDQRVEVFGSRGMVTVKNNTPDNHIFIDANGEHSALPLNFFMQRYTESYLNEMRAFVDSIKKDEQPPATGEDGLAAVKIGLAAMKSVAENRPVKMDEI